MLLREIKDLNEKKNDKKIKGLQINKIKEP